MITDSMTKKEIMLSLQKELREEIVPYYNNVIAKRLEREFLPVVQRTGKSIKKSFEKMSSGLNTFYIDCTVAKNGHNANIYCSFIWKEKKCYASFFDKETVVVYQKHCLERYAERVLNKNDIKAEDVFKKVLLNKQESAFQIVLQAPKRVRCRFYGLADALFLGDVDEPTKDNMNDYLYWYNTCLSLKETRKTQSGILYSLATMQAFVKSLGFNPLEITVSDKDRKREIDTFIRASETNKQNYTIFLKQSFMLYQLQLSLNFPWINLYINDINSHMEKISLELKKYGINTASLSPYGKDVGFAIKGEIDYRG